MTINQEDSLPADSTPPEQIRVIFYNSIIVRSVIAITILVVMAMLLSWHYRVQDISEATLAGLKQESARTAQVLAKSLALPLWNLDRPQVNLQLQALEQSSGFCGAQIKDTQDRVFANLHFPEKEISGQFTQTESIIFENEYDKIGEIGVLKICIDTHYLDKNLADIGQRELIFSLAIGFVIVILSGATLYMIVKPLLKIQEAMGLVSQTMEPIADPLLLGTDEVGSLARTFNRMVTDLKKTYHALETEKEKAVAADRYKSDFLANMSHELRTPLNSMLGMTDLLLEDNRVVKEHFEMLEVVRSAGKYLLENVNDILDLSKIEANKVTLEKIPFNLNQMLSRSVELLKPLAAKKGLAMTVDIGPGPLPDVLGDPTKMERIINNLLSNAVKYTETGGVILKARYVESATPEHIDVEISISDTGIGIPEDKLDKVFEKFTQAEDSTTRRFGGTGLGLTITRDLVELMNGKMNVTSRIGVGSKFWFTLTLPVYNKKDQEKNTGIAHVPAAQLFDPSAKRVPLKEARILVAEDHPLNKAFVIKLLERLGFQHIEIVENGKAAVDYATNHPCDAILMDAHMPVMTGYDATIAIRRHETLQNDGRHIPIVAMTADAMIGSRENCLKHGMDEFVSKPVDIELLKSVLSRWIDLGQTKVSVSAGAVPSPSVTHVDLTNLRSFTDGNKDTERHFIELFLKQSDINIDILSKNCVDGHCQVWRESAHQFKGGAANIGAEELRSLCAEAQGMLDSTAASRKEIFEKIRVSYTAVKEFLLKEISANN